jgi:hypothetical protein
MLCVNVKLKKLHFGCSKLSGRKIVAIIVLDKQKAKTLEKSGTKLVMQRGETGIW